MYRIRLDEVEGMAIDSVLELGKLHSYVIVRHELPHGNPHYHAYFRYEEDIKENTLRQRFKRKLPQLKSSDYSIKKCDADRINEYVQYMFNTKHGNRWELIDTRNFDNELLDSLKKNAQIITQEFEAARKQSKPKGPTIWELGEEVEREFQTKVQSLGNKFSGSNEELEVTIYTDIAIQVLRKHKKGFDEFLLRKVITTAMSSTSKGKEILRRKMVNSFCWVRT